MFDPPSGRLVSGPTGAPIMPIDNRPEGGSNMHAQFRKLAPAVLFLLACVALEAAVTETKTVMVTDKDNGKTLTMHKNDILVVTLEAQPGTGFLWHVGKNNDAVLKLE